jgi:hypothetical protein
VLLGGDAVSHLYCNLRKYPDIITYPERYIDLGHVFGCTINNNFDFTMTFDNNDATKFPILDLSSNYELVFSVLMSGTKFGIATGRRVANA